MRRVTYQDEAAKNIARAALARRLEQLTALAIDERDELLHHGLGKGYPAGELAAHTDLTVDAIELRRKHKRLRFCVVCDASFTYRGRGHSTTHCNEHRPGVVMA